MQYFIHTKTKRVIRANTREEAKSIFGLSWRQTEQEVNLLVPEDKDAIIPPELATEIAAFMKRGNE